MIADMSGREWNAKAKRGGVTGHQAFFTEDALSQIAETTLTSIHKLSSGVTPDKAMVVQI